MQHGILILVFAILFSPSVAAVSAIAIDNNGGFYYGISFNHADEITARQAAVGKCTFKGGANCVVKLVCTQPGYGALALRQVGPGADVEATGFGCGYASEDSARAGALRFCEYQVAVNLGATSVPIEGLSSASIRQILARACPGMGNCHCNTRATWLDSAN